MPDLDIEDFPRLRHYLLDHGHILEEDNPSFEKLSGGVSNRTVLVKRNGRNAMVLKQALGKLRVQVDWFSPPERIHIEAKALRWLPQLAPPGSIPGFFFEDFDNHILSMEAVPEGHSEWKSLLLQGILVPAHFEQFGALLGSIHRNSHERRGELAPVFEERSFFESLRLEPYYLYTAEQVSEAAPFLRGLVEETRRVRTAVVHGDYSPKNILIVEEKLVLLDCEVAHFGDPAFDLGFSLTHLLSKGHRDPAKRAEFLSAARGYWRSYLKTIQNPVAPSALSSGLEARAVRHTLGCLLARVAGRSTLEYLGPEQRRRQSDVACLLMKDPPSTVEDLILKFAAELEAHAAHL